MINLMPPEAKTSIRFARMNVSLLQYCLLVIVVSLALIAFMFAGILLVRSDESLLNEAITEKESSLDELKKTENEAKQLADKVNTVAALLDREVDYAALIQEIGSIIPIGASLRDLSLSGDTGALNLTTTTDTQDLAAVVRSNIEDSDLFSGADIETISNGELNENNIPINFVVTISAVFAPEAPPGDAP